MDKRAKILLVCEARIIQEIQHERGHWGSLGNGDNGWIGHIIVLGICIVSILFTIVLSY